MNSLAEQLYQLIIKTSTDMPEDVEDALQKAAETEKKAGNSLASEQISQMLENIKLARTNRRPLCQDTGLINFYVNIPSDFDKVKFITAAEVAIIRATEEGTLRKNSVCSITGKNSGDNLGIGTPAFYWGESGKDIQVRLLLKGGGSENVGTQYALPDASIEADRDMDGVRKCIIDAVKKAQGKGCPPSVISAVIGGDRASGYAAAKKAFFRKIGERSTTPELAKFEEETLKEINSLGIGPMGLGGAVTSLDLFVTALNRHPASFFVSVSQMCWSCRRGNAVIEISSL